MAAPQITVLPPDAFARVLCVVAHPDDVEYGTSSAVAAWTASGTEVAYLLLTRGEARMDSPAAGPHLDEGLEPHPVRWLLVGGDPRPTHGVDVTGDPLERGIASLEAHGQYLAGIPGHPAPRLMLSGVTALQGRALGVRHAVLFRAFDFRSPPPIALEATAAAADGRPVTADG